MAEKNYYEILGIDEKAKLRSIKSAYRKTALKHHPEHNSAPDAAERLIEIQQAFDILKNPIKRKKYDLLRKSTTHAASKKKYRRWSKSLLKNKTRSTKKANKKKYESIDRDESLMSHVLSELVYLILEVLASLITSL